MFYTLLQRAAEMDYSAEDGIACHVIVEADSRAEAIAAALEIGIYFNGVATGIDCPCCGDRWTLANAVTERPILFGQPVEEISWTDGTPSRDQTKKWARPHEHEVFVHYKDGRVIGYGQLRP